MCYPENFLRGIKNSTYLSEDGHVRAHLFHFDNNQENNRWEQSINWEDDDSAIDYTLNYTGDDDVLLFGAGLAVVPRDCLECIGNWHTIEGNLSYDHCESPDNPDNPYHGNILLASSVPKRIMKMVAGAIALAVSEIIPGCES